MDAQTRLCHSPDATFQIVAGEAILIHLQTGHYYSLNDVGTRFWELLDGQRSVADCATVIAGEYNAPGTVILSDLLELAADLHKEGLAAV